jgi:hypothetical protein
LFPRLNNMVPRFMYLTSILTQKIIGKFDIFNNLPETVKNISGKVRDTSRTPKTSNFGPCPADQNDLFALIILHCPFLVLILLAVFDPFPE